MNLVEAIRTTLAADTTLANLATGGIWSHDEIVAQDKGRDGLTLKVIAASGSALVRPSLYVMVSAEGPLFPVKSRGKRVGIEIYFYDQADYTTILTMRERVYQLLHEQRISFDDPAGWSCRQIVFVGNLRTLRDPNLGNACMERSSYEVRISQVLVE